MGYRFVFRGSGHFEVSSLPYRCGLFVLFMICAKLRCTKARHCCVVVFSAVDF